MIVVDASVVIGALAGSGPDRDWAAHTLGGNEVMGPQHLPVEVANALRRMSVGGTIDSRIADRLHDDLLALDVELVPYRRVAARAWELRHNVTTYDGCYVALAEAMEVPLATLDERLARASGPTCEFLLPPAN